MRVMRFAAAAVAVAALVPGLSVPASAKPGPLFGLICGFTSTNDETGIFNQDPRHQYGEMHIGPLLLGSLGSLFPITVPPTVPTISPLPTLPSVTRSATLRCWLQDNPNYDFTNAPLNELPLGHRYGCPGLTDLPYPGLANNPWRWGIEVTCLPGVCAGGGAIEYDLDPAADVYECISITDIDGDPTNDWLWDDRAPGTPPGDLVPWNSVPAPVCGLAISAG